MTTAKRSRSASTIESATRPRPALEIAGVRPSKSRGQNFLTSAGVAERIVVAAGLEENDEVVEIGPGLGILTERIATRRFRRLTLVELDSRLAERLGTRFADDNRIRVINADFLEAEIPAIFEKSGVKVIGNLPFNVAAAILRRLSDNSRLIARMVLMFQREVAARIRARAGEDNYSALSVYTALYWKIDFHFAVAAGSFHPRPKVDAEVLGFRPLEAEAKPFAADEEQQVLRVVRASFSAPRKTIRNSLGHGLGFEAPKVEPVKILAALEQAGIDPAARAETLAAGDFVRLARTLQSELRNKLLIH